MKAWHPHYDLNRLLQGLAEEIVAGDNEEVRQLSGLTGHSTAHAAREVRAVIAAVTDSQDEPDASIPLAEAMQRCEIYLKSH